MRKSFHPLANPSHFVALVLTIAFLLAGAIPAVRPHAALADAQAPRADGSPEVTEGPTSAEIAWIREFDRPAEGVAVDAEGSAYVVGHLVQSWRVDTATCISWSTGDGVYSLASLTKYDADGNELWTRLFGASGWTGASAVTVDSTGVYVTGPTFGNFSGLEKAGKSDVYVRKYDLDGNVVWTQQYGGSEYDVSNGIDVDATGVYVAGSTCSTLGTIPGAQNGEAFVTKLDLDGNLVWTRQYGSPYGRAEAIAVHLSGVYVTGTGGAFTRKLDPNGEEVWTRSISGQGITADDTGIYVAAGGLDAFVQKYDADGNAIWTRQFGTSGNDTAFAVAVDGTGVYVTGATDGAFPGQENAGYADAFVHRFGLDGDEGWTIQFGGLYPDWGLGIDAQGSGIYVAVCADEYSIGVREWCRSGTGLLAKLASENAAVEVAWIRQFGTSANESADAVASDASGNVYVVGRGVSYYEAGCVSWGAPDVPAGPAFLRKYDSAGNVLWTRWDYGVALAADSSGVYLTRSNYVWKYDVEGNPVWTQQIGGSNSYRSAKIAADGTGVYVAGNYAFVAKLDIEGNLVWMSQFGTSADDQAEAIAVGASGLYVAGSGFLRRVDPDGREVWTRQTALSWAAGVDLSGVYLAGFTPAGIVVQKYDQDGNLSWNRTFETHQGRYIASGRAAAVGASGVYTAGNAIVGGGCPNTFVQGNYFDGDTWTRQFATDRMEVPRDVAVDGSAVYVVGWTSGGFPGQPKAGGLDGFIAKIVLPNAPPRLAGITTAPAAVIPGQNVTLTVAAIDPNGDPLTYTWDFGDGMTATGTTAPGGGAITATHAYAEADTYTVTLTVDDGKGGVTTKFTNVRVVAPLSLEISADQITGTVPLTVSFAANPSGGVPPYSFEWDFGDGSSSTTQNPTHTYPVAGTYTVTLDTTAADGRTMSKTIQITASPAGSTVAGTDIPPWVPYALVTAVAVGIGGAILWRWRGRVRAPPSPPGSS